MFKKEQRCWGLEQGECEEGPERKEVGGRAGTKGQIQRGVAFVKMEAFILRETGSLGRVWAESDTRMTHAYILEGTVWLLC